MIAGRYRLEREIGRGGAGIVHLAHDEVLGRDVAIKRIGLLPGTTGHDIARAEREARLAAGINHPHVVSIFDLVKDEDCHWLVMEYVEGQTLTEVIKADGPLHHTRAAGIVAQAADALVQASKAGIVHRDVKPSNIMVNADDHAKLADFGIARAASDAVLTQTGLVTGSPAYLAPEVASGESATAASDVWSLGATFFHALVGHPPYDVSENLIGGLYKIVHDDPPRLPEDHPAAGLLAVMMVKDPEKRWPVLEVRDDLRRLARGERSTAPPPVTVPSGEKQDSTVVLGTPITAEEAATAAVPVVASAPTPRPAPVSPAAAAPKPAPRPAPAPPPVDDDRDSRFPLGWIVAALAALALVAALGAWLLWPGDDPRDNTAGDTGTEQTQEPTAEEPAEEQSETEEPAEEPEETEEPTEEPSTPPATGPAKTRTAMQAFVENYFATVTSNPEATYAMLTPAFQEQSGGFGGYSGFWSTISSARPYDIQADPRSLTTTYTIDYVSTSGRTSTQQITLQLQRAGDGFLIAGESR